MEQKNGVKLHTVTLRDERPEPRRLLCGVRGSQGTDYLRLRRGRGWEGLSLTVAFYPADGSDAIVLAAEEDEPIRVPDAVLACRGRSRFVVTGRRPGMARCSLSGWLDVME